VEQLLGLQRRLDQGLLGDGRAGAGVGEQVAGEQRGRRLVEPQAALPVVGHVRRRHEPQPVGAEVEDLAVAERVRRPVGQVAERQHARQTAVDHLGAGGVGQQQVHGPALVGLDVGERDPAQIGQGHHPGDGRRHQRVELAHPGVEQERLLVPHQELVEGEAPGSDLGDEGGESVDVGGDLVDRGLHGSGLSSGPRPAAAVTPRSILPAGRAVVGRSP
jgi:hypothetical protein